MESRTYSEEEKNEAVRNALKKRRLSLAVFVCICVGLAAMVSALYFEESALMKKFDEQGCAAFIKSRINISNNKFNYSGFDIGGNFSELPPLP